MLTRVFDWIERGIRMAVSGGPRLWRGLRSFVLHPLTIVLALLAAAAWGASRFVVELDPGQGAVRINRLTGSVSVLSNEWGLGIPGVTRLIRYPVREQVFRTERGMSATAPGAFQSLEGLQVGADITVRYQLDQSRIREIAPRLPADVGRELIEPVIDSAIHRTLAQHTVREIFSTGRHDIEAAIEKEIKDRLTSDGVVIRAVFLGHVDLPEDYRTGMEQLLREELSAEKMRFTLELRDKQVKEAELTADAEKVKREKEAEATGNQEIIEAKAREEAMQHILPFKEREIEEHRLEAEAARVTRIKTAEAEADARRIEAAGEADSRRKLADAEAYRLEVTGKAMNDQMAREGAVVSQNPLLIQKTLADKLSDKIQVIITPPQTGFVAGGLLGFKDGVPPRPAPTPTPTPGAPPDPSHSAGEGN